MSGDCRRSGWTGNTIEKELAASYTRRAQNIWPHTIRSQSEARDLLAGKESLRGPFVLPNDTRIAQDSLFRVSSLKRSNCKESGIRLPFRPQADLDEPTTFRQCHVTSVRKPSMSLSGSIDIAFSRNEEKPPLEVSDVSREFPF